MIEARILKNVIAFMDRAAVAGLETQENLECYLEARRTIDSVMRASLAMDALARTPDADDLTSPRPEAPGPSGAAGPQ